MALRFFHWSHILQLRHRSPRVKIWLATIASRSRQSIVCTLLKRILSDTSRTMLTAGVWLTSIPSPSTPGRRNTSSMHLFDSSFRIVTQFQPQPRKYCFIFAHFSKGALLTGSGPLSSDFESAIMRSCLVRESEEERHHNQAYALPPHC